MIRFEAGPEEVEGLIKFLRHRTPQKRLLLAPLPPASVAPLKNKVRSCVTAQSLLRALAETPQPLRWGLSFPTQTPATSMLSESDCLMQLFFGTADARGRREVLLEVQDELAGEPPDLTERSVLARDLGVRAVRRLRRRGCHEGLHWIIPT